MKGKWTVKTIYLGVSNLMASGPFIVSSHLNARVVARANNSNLHAYADFGSRKLTGPVRGHGVGLPT